MVLRNPHTTCVCSQLEEVDKGDMLDFKLDGGMNAQTFEGQDYSAEGRRQQAPIIDKMLLLEEECMQQRVRKPVANYNESGGGPERIKKPKKPRSVLPEHLRVPSSLHSWQFIDSERLLDLVAEEEAEFLRQGEAVLAGVTSAALLGEEKAAEKARLLSDGFPRWRRSQFDGFVRASSRYGRESYAEILCEIPGIEDEAEVRRYADAFWGGKGAAFIDEVEWVRITSVVERGEKRLAADKKLSDAAREVFESFEDPWTQLTLQGSRREFTSAEDRCLFCLAHTFGFGQWGRLQQELIRISAVQPELQLGYYLFAAGAERIGTRCEELMKAALAMVEKKDKGECEADEVAEEKVPEGRSLSATSAKEVKERASSHSTLERELAEIEVELANAKSIFFDTDESGDVADGELVQAAMKYDIKGDSDAGGTSSTGGLGELFGTKNVNDKAAGGGGPRRSGGNVKSLLAADLEAPLAAFVVESKAAGVDKLVDAFLEQHKERGQTKRAIKDFIERTLIKEKNAEGQVLWRQKTDSEMAAARAKAEAAASSGGSVASGDKAKKSEKRKPAAVLGAEGRDEAKKMKPVADDKGSSPKKRKASDQASEGKNSDAAVIGGGSGAAGSSNAIVEKTPRAPRKAKTALAIFVAEKRTEVKRDMKGLDPDCSNAAIDEELKRRWGLLSPPEVESYEGMARLDDARYKRELKTFHEKQLSLERESNKAQVSKKNKKEAGSSIIPKKSSALVRDDESLSSPSKASAMASIPKKAPSAVPTPSIPKKAPPAAPDAGTRSSGM